MGLLQVILVGLIYLTRASCFMDYTQEKMEQCHIDSSKQVIHNIDLYMIIIISPFSLCAALIVIWTFLKFSESRKQPSDMVFSVSACDAVLNIHWLMSSIYQIAQDSYSAPDKHSFFCEFNAFLSTTAGSLEYLYNILFCVFLITRMRNSLEGSRIRKSRVHGFCWVGALGFYAFFKIQGKTGVNSYGMCSYEASSDTYIAGIALFAIYWLLSGFTLGFFKKYVPDSQAFKEQKQDFIRFYFGYSIITNISWLLIAVSNTITSLNCKYLWGPSLGIFITMGNATKVITPIFSAIVRFKDPTLQQCMRNYKIMQKEKEIEMSLYSTQKGKSSFFESFVLRNSSIVHRSFEGSKAQQDDIINSNHVSWSNSLSQNLKLLRIVSIFAGLSVQDDLRKTPPQIVKKHANIRYYDNSMIKDHDLESFPEGDIHHMRMKAYFEDEFVELRERDAIPIDMKTVFSIPSNLEALKKITSLIGDGGRSGQMVLSNFDGKIIIKTVSSADVSSFIKISDKYFNYMKTNHESTLIVLIYGLYTFKRVDAQDSKTHLLIMKNITASIPKSLVLRKYDLKGSRYDRAVLSKHKLSAAEFIGISQHSSSYSSEGKEEIGVIPSWVLNYNDKRNSYRTKEHDFSAKNNLRNVSNWLNRGLSGKSEAKKEYVKLNQITMKDADFEKLEKKAFLSEEHSKIIKTTLQKDCVFLRNCGLIDYSLLICKVAGLNGICKNSSTANSASSSGVSCAYPSTQEPEVFYFLGIIDYLQEWNIDKLLEQKAKKTLNVNPNLNVSSQNPTTYCSRFILNVIDAFF